MALREKRSLPVLPDKRTESHTKALSYITLTASFPLNFIIATRVPGLTNQLFSEKVLSSYSPEITEKIADSGVLSANMRIFT